ncbi:MAG: hypothetical protein H3C54_12375, partial [Taibaiella sp.]|nr:hypothetical protein [Taibaiella sp.]
MTKTLHITCVQIMLFIISFTLNTSGQDFRWGERGGSTQSAGDAQVETIYDMDVDKNGNVYVLSRVYKTDISVGGHTIQGYGNKDVLLSSFNCQGKFRWMKLFGNSIGDIGYDVCTDKTDGVYVVFDMMAYNDSGYIDSDSTIAANTTKTLYLVKYDTSGNLKWTRTPQPDTIPITSSSFTGSIDMGIDEQGDITWFCQLAPGEYGGTGGLVVNDTSDYILKYDRNGNF